MTEYISQNGNGSVKFWDTDRFPILSTAKKVLFLLSGGADSCLTFYLLLTENEKLNLNLEITVMTANETYRPKKTDVDMPIALLEKFKNMFPNANIVKHLRPDVTEINGKNLVMRPIMEKMFRDKLIDLEVDGVTANPPVEVMKDLGLYEEGIKKRVFGEMHTENGMYYHPLALIHKKFVADMYVQLGITELIPLTWSCVSKNTDPDNPIPCGTCWWCIERKWAFGDLEKGI